MDTKNPEQLVYEETPIIEPIEEKKLPDPLDVPELSPGNTTKRKQIFLGALFYGALFILGIIVSVFVRPYIVSKTSRVDEIKETETVEEKIPPPLDTDPFDGWISYSMQTQSGDVTYKLPPDIKAPVCDGTSCLSKGTYFPGGSRFTVSAKTTKETIENFEKLIVKDANGKPFDTKQTSVAGLKGIDFAGAFTGLTTGGYTFTAMHGVMLLLPPTVLVEMNHFAPGGLSVDFKADEVVFAQILMSVRSVSSSSATMR